MHVRATVVTAPTADRAIVDAGSKVLTRTSTTWRTTAGSSSIPRRVVAALSEEHGDLDLSRSARSPKVGEVVNIIPNHCCVVSNMVDEVYGIRDGGSKSFGRSPPAARSARSLDGVRPGPSELAARGALRSRPLVLVLRQNSSMACQGMRLPAQACWRGRSAVGSSSVAMVMPRLGRGPSSSKASAAPQSPQNHRRPNSDEA